MSQPAQPTPSPRQIRRWRRYLAEERAEAALYRELAMRRQGEEHEILLQLAEAEGRHAAHWEELLGVNVGLPRNPRLGSRMLTWMARRFDSVLMLTLAQRAESRSSYSADEHATATMAADERIHEEVIRSLAARGRQRMSGSFRAAIFGMNDGLVSNLALVLAIGAAGSDTKGILLAGIAGLLAGALSMGAGEYVSVRSQLELLAASTPSEQANEVLPVLDVGANELALVYRARGMSEKQAEAYASEVFARLDFTGDHVVDEHEEVGSAWSASVSSFLLFSAGAIVPVLPYLFGATGTLAVVLAAALVGLALVVTGSIVGLLSGAPPLRRALRQLAIGWGAAAATYALGLAFDLS